MENYLISAAIILPVSEQPLTESSVAVSNGLIEDIGKTKDLSKKYGTYKNINLGNGILLPGFINCHTHLELGWTKNLIEEVSDFTEWLKQLLKVKSEYTNMRMIRDSVREGISELVGSGVSTVGEISSYDSSDLELLHRSGLRTVLFREIVDSNSKLLDNYKFGKINDLIETRPFLHAPYSCSPELISRVIDICMETNIPFSIHLAESEEEVKFVRNETNEFEKTIYKIIGKTPFRRHTSTSPLNYIIDGFKKVENTRMTAVHMVQVGQEDVLRIKSHDIGVVVCPRSNIMLGVGEPPLDLYKNIERLGIGTDGLSSNYNLDFFEELRCFNKIAEQIDPEHSSRHTVNAATLGGARSLFIEDRTGSIESGKFADLLFIRTSDISQDPHDIVIGSSPDDMQFLMINGKIIINKST